MTCYTCIFVFENIDYNNVLGINVLIYYIFSIPTILSSILINKLIFKTLVIKNIT